MPRSRSLWHSFLFTGTNSYCYHEALPENITGNPRTLPRFEGVQLVGSSDTSPLAYSEEVVGDSPLILIHRPLDDIKSALAKSHGFKQEQDPTGYLDRSYERLNTIEADNIMHVNFNELDNPKVLNRMLGFTGVSVGAAHIRKLMGSRIVVNNPQLFMLATS